MSEFQAKYDGKLLSPKDVGVRLGISVTRVLQLTAKKALPAARTLHGRRVYYRDDVDEFDARRAQRGR